MKTYRLATFAAALAAAGSASADTTASDAPDWLNIQGIGWDGGPDAGPLYRITHGLGYKYQYHGQKHDDYEGPYRRDLGFFYNDPHKHIQPLGPTLPAGVLERARQIAPFTFDRWPMLPRAIDMDELRQLKAQLPEAYAVVERAFNETKSWANTNQAFPNNLAQLQTWGDGEVVRWEPSPDYQRQSVIDAHVQAISDHLAAQERVDDGYLFKGIVIDVPELWKEFNWSSDRKLPGSPDEARSCVGPHDHEFATLQEGWYHFLHDLHVELHDRFPERDVKFIYEPSDLWVDWAQHVATIEYDSVTSDMIPALRGDALVGEKPTLAFLTQQELFDDGWTLGQLGNVTGDLFPKNPSYPLQVRTFGEIASRGSNFFAYGTFAREFDRALHTYSPDLLLLRAIAGWENTHGTPLEERLFDREANVYLSPTAVVGNEALAVLDPHLNIVRGVVREPGATVVLGDDVEVDEVFGINEYFEPTDQPGVEVKDRRVVAKSGAKFPVGFRIALKSEPKVAFGHPNADALVHRPMENPVIQPELFNGDFELGGDAWYTGDGGGVRVVPETKVVKEGGRSGKLVQRTQAWHSFTQRVPDVFGTKGPGTYRASAWIRATQPTRAFVDLKIESADAERSLRSDPVELKANEWTKLEAEFDVEFEKSPAVANLGFRIEHPTQPYFLDDAKLKKVSQ